MNAALAFGKGELLLNLPDGPKYEVIRAQSARALADAGEAIRRVLDAPIGCAPLAEVAAGKKTAAVLVCDITRPAPNAITLPPVLERLQRAGIPPAAVTIVIATGLHRVASDEEIKAIVGPALGSGCRVVNHDARNPGDHCFLGYTRRGTPVSIDRRFVEADLHLTLGLIEPHLMLGFSGGRKLIAPGVAAQETIRVIHSPKFMRQAMATEGSICENPLHQELLEMARMAGQDFMLDVTLTPSREISGVFAGEPVHAHAAGVEFLRQSSSVYLDEPVDAVITSAAGYPLDLTFYQTIKGITAAQHILRPQGRILIASKCSEGIGSPEFAKKLRNYRGAQEYLDEIQDTPVEVDQWQLEKLALVERLHPVLFHTPGAPAEVCGAIGLRSYGSPEEAVQALISASPDAARVAIIPEGPYTFARVRGDKEGFPGGSGEGAQDCIPAPGC